MKAAARCVSRGQLVVEAFQQQERIRLRLRRPEFLEIVQLRLQPLPDVPQLVFPLDGRFQLDVDQVERPEQLDLGIQRIEPRGLFTGGLGRLFGFGHRRDLVRHLRPFGLQIVGRAGGGRIGSQRPCACARPDATSSA